MTDADATPEVDEVEVALRGHAPARGAVGTPIANGESEPQMGDLD